MRRRFGPDVVIALSEAQNHRCAYCQIAVRLPGERCADRLSRLAAFADRRSLIRFHVGRYATVEHLVPLSCGGTNVAGNLVMACRWCNGFRGRAPLDVAYEAIRALVTDGLHPLHRAIATGVFVDGVPRIAA